jgi:hypothetical protein
MNRPAGYHIGTPPPEGGKYQGRIKEKGRWIEREEEVERKTGWIDGEREGKRREKLQIQITAWIRNLI